LSSDTELDTSVAAHSDGAQALGARNRLVIGLLLASAFVVLLNETIMGVAIPQLIVDLDITAGTAQWLTAAFLLTMAVVIPITGYLIQRFHSRPLFVTAMSLFVAGTALAAVAPGFPVLLVGRIIQASGTAIIFPLLMTTVMTLVPPATRGRMMGNISIVMSVAPAIGPTISGVILSAFSWRFMFIFVLPIAIAALVLGIVFMKNISEPVAGRIDVLSIVLSAFGFGALVYGLSVAGTATSALELWLPIGVGLMALALFVWRQIALQKHDRALLDLRTFRSANFSLSVVMFAISMMAMFGVIVLLPLYLVNALDFDELNVGLLLLPGGLVTGLLGPLVGRFYDRSGPRIPLIGGAILVSAVLWTMAMVLDVNSTWPTVLTLHILLSVGLSLLFTPLFTASLGSLRPRFYASGSAIIGTIQQLAGAAGTAIFITVMSSQIARLEATGASSELATAEGVHTAFLFGAAISLAGILVSFFIRKPADQPGPPPMVH
jgi:DHA2 family lincomycin resistance protein-like MFS transporter